MRLSLSADDLIILPQKRFFVKHFFEKLLNFSKLKSFSSFSVLTVSLSGVRPLHLAFARPLCLLERPTGAIHCFRNRKTFERSLVLFKGFLLRLQKSFFCLSAWRSHIVPYRNHFCKPFLHFFRLFLRFVNYRQFSAGNRRVF